MIDTPALLLSLTAGAVAALVVGVGALVYGRRKGRS